MARTKKDRETETFSLSFLDAVTCAFGAVILLLVLTKIYEPQTIERSKVELEGLLAALQKELFEIRGETAIMNREMVTVDEQLSDSKDAVARLRGDVSDVRGQFAATQDNAEIDSEVRGELVAARQKLTEEMKRLLANYRPDEDDTTVGGIPVDSEYIVFVIDTSGSMFQGPWRLVLRKLDETLSVYPEVKGIQVLNDEGKYMFSSYAGKWIPDSPTARRNIISRLANWNPYSDSSPVEGIAEAINTFYEPGKPISIFVFGDDFPRGQVEAVARFVDRVNKVDAEGNRLVRIHGVGFPTQLAGGRMRNAQQFANLMRTLCERNGGSFVALTYLN
ncbi:MAG: VWA domain-containing protein [Gammaproteobacteria bacterium]|nr:VWA domain-containing protein [Gammaproteobacteria bacterium]MBT8445182.1 VWA domain-containing protein [Gammaproteobacteria bacterium]NND36871.1 VWA domain-containing protein [Gammaproteobacteria bacterium]